jgi:hypothetical protein
VSAVYERHRGWALQWMRRRSTAGVIEPSVVLPLVPARVEREGTAIVRGAPRALPGPVHLSAMPCGTGRAVSNAAVRQADEATCNPWAPPLGVASRRPANFMVLPRHRPAADVQPPVPFPLQLPAAHATPTHIAGSRWGGMIQNDDTEREPVRLGVAPGQSPSGSRF